MHFREWQARRNDPVSTALLPDLVENFTLFSEHKAGRVKIIGQNHQFLGVSNATGAVSEPEGDACRAASRQSLNVRASVSFAATS